MKANLEEAQKLCAVLEPKLRRRGWHIAVTGSVLYGRIGKTAARSTPRDIDLIVYPHIDSAEEHLDDSLGDLLQSIGITDAEPSGDYGNPDYGAATVYEFFISGIKVNVMQLVWKEFYAQTETA